MSSLKVISFSALRAVVSGSPTLRKPAFSPAASELWKSMSSPEEPFCRGTGMTASTTSSPLWRILRKIGAAERSPFCIRGSVSRVPVRATLVWAITVPSAVTMPEKTAPVFWEKTWRALMPSSSLPERKALWKAGARSSTAEAAESAICELIASETATPEKWMLIQKAEPTRNRMKTTVLRYSFMGRDSRLLRGWSAGTRGRVWRRRRR